MLLNLLFLREPTAGHLRYVIVRHSKCQMFLPDLMRIRFYVGDDGFYTSLDYFLPKYHNKIEFDTRTEEWYIANEEVQ